MTRLVPAVVTDCAVYGFTGFVFQIRGQGAVAEHARENRISGEQRQQRQPTQRRNRRCHGGDDHYRADEYTIDSLHYGQCVDVHGRFSLFSLLAFSVAFSVALFVALFVVLFVVLPVRLKYSA